MDEFLSHTLQMAFYSMNQGHCLFAHLSVAMTCHSSYLLQCHHSICSELYQMKQGKSLTFGNYPFTFNTLPDFKRLGTGIEFRCFPDGSAAILLMADRKYTWWHWKCVSALCKSNFYRKVLLNTRHRLTLNCERATQKSVLMNENVNWQKHVICRAHWSTGRKSKDQLPDVICMQDWGVCWKNREGVLQKQNCRAERKT